MVIFKTGEKQSLEKCSCDAVFVNPDCIPENAKLMGLGEKDGSALLARNLENASGKLLVTAAGSELSDAAAKSAAKSLASSGFSRFFANLKSSGLDSALSARRLVREISAACFKNDERKLSEKDDIGSLRETTISTSFEDDLQKASIIAESAELAKRLANTPGNEGYPEAMAWKASQAIAQIEGITYEIIHKEALANMGMNAYLAVCSGSSNAPAMLVAKYKGNPDSSDTYAIVGKGLTFDSGGLSLKPAQGMDEMMFDKCGACAAVAVIAAAARLKLKLNVSVVAAFAENMPDGASYRPGDIIATKSGKTVEVANTDAEGRLVLCDAISYAGETLKPKVLIDVATLTGGCVIALGHHMTGMFSNCDNLAESLKKAGDASADPCWRLPIDDDYRELVKGKNADLTNSAGRWASPITAAAFLENFTGDFAWAHLDIAGTAWNSDTKCATGRPVDLLVAYLENEAAGN